MRRNRKETVEAVVGMLGDDFQRRGKWVNYRCVFHDGSRYNLGMNFASDRFVCLGCGENGTIEELRQKLLDMGHDEGGGLLALVGTSETEDDTLSAAGHGIEATDETPAKLHHDFMNSFTPVSMFSGTVSQRAVEKYLLARGVLDACRGRFLVGLSDKLPGRVVFPFIQNGLCRYYVARTFTKTGMKTLNPSQKLGWPGKNEILFNESGLLASSKAIICEGVFDAITADATGISPATCLLGKTISQEQIRLLKRTTKDVYVLLDRDAATNALDLAVKLYEAKFNVFLCQWPDHGDGKDPNEVGPMITRALLEEALPIDYEVAFRLQAQSL